MTTKPWELFKIIEEASFSTVGDELDYVITEIDGRPALIFEESRQRRDWENNFDFVVSLYKNGQHPMKVHRGFGNVWKSANDRIMADFIAACKDNDKTPLIAGWSFGGAMAVLAAEDFNFRTGRQPFVVTYGAPCVVGNKKTRDYIKSCGVFWQFVNRNDCVPLMPPLPWYHQINKVKVGEKFCIVKLFKPTVYHTNYHDKDIYSEWEKSNDKGI